MKEPNELALWLGMCTITTVTLSYELVGADRSETYLTMSGVMRDGKGGVPVERKENIRILSPYISFEPSHCALINLKQRLADECEAWYRFVEENEEDLQEYERLKKKLGK